MRTLSTLAVLLLMQCVLAGEAFSRTVFPSESVLPVLVYDIEHPLRGVIGLGSGVIMKGRELYLATAKHNVYPERRSGEAGLVALINNEPCPLERVWEHRVADVVLMRFRCDKALVARLAPLPLEHTPPKIGDAITLFGYQEPGRILGLTACWYFEGQDLCERIAPLLVSQIHAPMKDIAKDEADAERQVFAEVKQKYPKITYDDLFFSGYLIAELPRKAPSENFSGVSGGGAINKRGNLIGIFVAVAGFNRVFIPVREFPRELF